MIRESYTPLVALQGDDVTLKVNDLIHSLFLSQNGNQCFANRTKFLDAILD